MVQLGCWVVVDFACLGFGVVVLCERCELFLVVLVACCCKTLGCQSKRLFLGSNVVKSREIRLLISPAEDNVMQKSTKYLDNDAVDIDFDSDNNDIGFIVIND